MEGKPDRVLVLVSTGLPGREVRRERNKNEALKSLERDSNGKAMVDEDPGQRQPPLLLRMNILQNLDDLGLREYGDTNGDFRVIMLRPRLEEWLIQTAGRSGISLDNPNYNLPSDSKRLKGVINRDLRKLERLIDDLLAAQSPRIQKLQELLTS